ncbi:MAG: sigma-70 family RNA polymerase sigma factor [Myxococcota bacterium]
MTATVEASAKRACTREDYVEAATVLVEGYGPKILGFLTATLRNQTEAREAYSMFAEDLWRGLPRFEWRSSALTWCFTLARHARNRYVRAHNRRRAREPLTPEGWLEDLVAKTRTRTPLHRRSELKARMRALREQLPIDDQMLLMLRIDQGLSFRDVARILEPEESSDEAEGHARAAARLRKRLQLVKGRLRALAAEDGLLALDPSLGRDGGASRGPSS